jgi:hypothetical protein
MKSAIEVGDHEKITVVTFGYREISCFENCRDSHLQTVYFNFIAVVEYLKIMSNK